MDLSSITSFVVGRTLGKSTGCTRNTVSNLLKEITTAEYFNICRTGCADHPCKLHIKDPYFYDEIYASSSRKREKYWKSMAAFGAPSAMFSTIDHDHHRFRRGLLNTFFCKRSVLELSPIMPEQETKLMQRFEQSYKDNNVLELTDAFAAFTADLISQYLWGVSYIRRHFESHAPVAYSRLNPNATSILDIRDTVIKQSTSRKKPTQGSRTTIFDGLEWP